MKYLKRFDESTRSINTWCKKLNIKGYDINEDGSVDVIGYVDISSQGLSKIPIKFNIVRGSFYCRGNILKNLKGCPKEVRSKFDCSINNLMTLKDGPMEVAGDFDCGKNKLTTLEGMATIIGGAIHMRGNLIESLTHLPKQVKLSFSCSDNKLTSLEGAPEKVGGYFDCDENNLISLEGAPKEVGGEFYCDYNPIYNVFRLFSNYEYYQASLDFNYLRGNKIYKKRLQKALNEIHRYAPDVIEGYEYI
jgi:hypothetical protein